MRKFIYFLFFLFIPVSSKAESVRGFADALELDSLAEESFAEGDFDRSISLWREAAGIADRFAVSEADSLLSSGFLQSLGVCYRRKSMMDSTLYYYNKAWDIIRDKTSPAAVSEKTRLLTSMAILFTFMGRDEESVRYADRAMEMAAVDNDMEMVMYATSNAGAIYVRNGDFEKGAAALRTAVSKAEENGQPDKQLSALTLLISIFNNSGDADSVDYYISKAEKFVDLLPSESVAVQGFLEVQAMALRNMGRYAESNSIYSKLMDASRANSSVREDMGYLVMARNYADLGQWSDAADCYEKAYSAIDSVYNEEITAQLSEWSARYGAAESELKIAKLTQESLESRAAMQMWIIVALVLVAILLAVIMTVVFRRRHQKKVEELNLARKYIEGLEKERARVAKDLHDGVCNDLLGIGMQISAMNADPSARSQQENIVSMLEELRSEVRTISHDMMPPSFSLSDIEEVMAIYVDRFRLQTTAEIVFKASTVGSMTWQQVPDRVAYEVYRIFQEHMANIIKHSGAGHIEAELTLSDTQLSLAVTNDGKPFDVRSGSQNSGNGVGLKVISERARAIGAVISCSESDGLQVFRLDVPMEDKL